MYNFYQYERQNRSKAAGTDVLSNTVGVQKPAATLQAERGRAKSLLGTESTLETQQASVEMRRKSDGNVRSKSPTQKKERLVESYKSRVASFIKDVS